MEIKRQIQKLPQGEIIENLPSIKFAEDNSYRFGMDFGFWQNVPSDIKFYPISMGNGTVTFVGDGYGLTHKYKEKYGLSGKYGSGAIYVYAADIPHLIDWCKDNLIEKN